MTTITFDTASAAAVAAPKAVRNGRSFLGRVVDAIAESNRRKAEIETRRVLALIGEPKVKTADYAMLPFQGE